jgi:hypothetical protein
MSKEINFSELSAGEAAGLKRGNNGTKNNYQLQGDSAQEPPSLGAASQAKLV